MTRTIGFAILLLWLTGPTKADDRLVRETEPLSPAQELAALQVPEGFEIQLFAAEPQINKPINLGFDQRGRLWVSSTVEYPYAAEKDRWQDDKGSRVRDSLDAIKILEDTNGDGSADKISTFADGLNIPTGVLPWHKPEHQSGCIAWSIPNIWYFADTTGDGKCDLREVLFGPLGYEKDTHGMCSSFRMGKDGWVYATHGFNNTSHIVAKDGSTLDLHSGNVFRFRPDGSRVEIWSRGQVNPFGLCFDRRGNLYSADCHSSPIYQLLQGATYPSFGKPHDGLGFGPAMIEHSHGSTGIAGIVYLEQNVWGEEWNDHILIGNPVNSRVNLDRIEFDGSTPRAIEKPDFIASEDPWFRPVDLALGPDGALYIADFYNRIIGHYEVPLTHPGRDRERGRIWRVVKKAKTKTRPEPPSETLPTDPKKGLNDPSPFVKRTSASLLYSSPEREAIPVILQSLNETPDEDTHLQHALKLALRECLSLPDVFPTLDPDPDIARVALAIPSGPAADYLLKIDPDNHQTLPVSFGKSRLIHIAGNGKEETIEKLISTEESKSQGPIFAAAALSSIIEGLEESGANLNNPQLLSRAQDVAKEILELRNQKGAGTWVSLPSEGSPSPWSIQERSFSDGSTEGVISSLRKGEKNAEQRTGTLRSKAFPAPENLSFWICGHRGFPGQPPNSKSFVRLIVEGSGKEIRREFPPRQDACQKVIWNLENHVGEKVQLEIVDGDDGKSYAWLGVGRITGAAGITAQSFQEDDSAARHLGTLAGLLKFSAPIDLRDQLKPFLPQSPPPPPREISEEDQKKIDVIIASRINEFKESSPNLEKGELVFTTHCAACHQIERKGGVIGPQLDGIGSRGLERLAEDILDPNRNVDAHFRLTTITMKDGTVTGGFVNSEKGEIVEVIDATGKRHRLSKGEINQRNTSSMSLMPAQFGEFLSKDDFRDLLAWLLR